MNNNAVWIAWALGWPLVSSIITYIGWVYRSRPPWREVFKKEAGEATIVSLIIWIIGLLFI